MAQQGFFQGVAIGAPSAGSPVYQTQQGIMSQGESALSRQAQAAHLANMQRRPEEEQRQPSNNNNFNRNQFQQSPATTPTTSSPTGSNLVSGGPGTGMAASYGSSFGLGGSVSAGGLGSYAGGAGGLMSASGGGAAAGGWSGLGAASSGLSYGGATGASTLGAGSTGWGSLAGSSAGMSYGGGAAASGGAAAGGGAMSGIGAAGPWAALAAVIIANENTQKKTGNRREGTQYYKDLFGGKVFEQDMNKYADKWDEDNKLGINSDMKTIGNLNTLDFSNAWDNAKKGGVLGGLIKKIF